MTRLWMGVALTLLCLGFARSASAQQSALPEPVPFAPSSIPQGPPPAAGPQLYPGPLPPEAAPPGPPPELSLPANLPGAFQEPPPPASGAYLYLGARAFRRNGLGNSPIASVDRNNTTNLDTGELPLSPRFLRPVHNFNSVPMNTAWGAEAALGWYSDNAVLELSGFYVPQNSSEQTTTRVGRLFLFFNPTPVGFEGNNGMWRQADRVTTTYESSLGNVEVNYRWWNRGVEGFEPMIGVRYLDQMERVSIFTDDDGVLVRDINNRPDPLRQATYSLRAQNRIVAPQLGFEWNRHFLPWFSVGLMGKGAWGVNFVNVEQTLRRGDGYSAAGWRRNDTTFSQLYEFGVHADVYLLERLRVRLGFDGLFLANINEASDQINFNLRDRDGAADNNGSIFYYGPTIQVQMLF